MKRVFTPNLLLLSNLGARFLSVAIFTIFTFGAFAYTTSENPTTENNLNLEEPSTPLVFCPHDVYVSCLNYNGNPSSYGQPTVTNAGAHVTITEHPAQHFTNSCGIGYIIRTWTIHMPYGVYNCSQRITITGSGSSFGAYHINWPPDYHVSGCHADLHPDNIPHPYNRPTWTSAACAMIGVNYHDEVFYFNSSHYGGSNSGTGCKKILRTWTLIDWCTYNTYTGAGRWSHVQIIKIEDDRAPVFTHCPPDFTVGTYDNNCNGAYVNFPRPFATDNCTQNVIIRNNSPYTYNYGSDASGFYPLGMTTVRFIADDGCQNYDTCFVRVHVRDLKKPTPFCHVGVSTTLMPMNGDGFVQVNPRVFDAGSIDNCTPKHLLQFSLVPNTFTCADLGMQSVRLFVTDQSGNTDFCNTFIRIEDNMGVCPPDTSGGRISGLVEFINGVLMPEVGIYANMDNEDPDAMTSDEGIYALEDLVEGYDYEIMASKNGSLLEGISTLDLIQLRKHITGEKRLDNPYKIIAADINMDGQVTIQDYLQLRMMLLLGINEFPGMKPWRFIDKAYEFENPLNPLAEDFTEVYMIEDHDKTDMNINFIGVKLGDLDGSCMPLEDDDKDDFASIYDRAVNTLELKMENKSLVAGSTIKVDLLSDTKIQLHGLQMTLVFDTDLLTFNGIEAGVLSGLSDKNIGLHRLDEGLITISWEQVKGVQVDLDQVMGALNFTVKSYGHLAEALTISSAPLKSEAYDSELNLLDIQLNVFNSDERFVTGSIDLLQSAPNPFSDECVISYHMPENRTAELLIHDISGRMVASYKMDAVKGLNTIVLKSVDFPAPGMYTYTLVSDGFRSTKKLLYK